MKIKIIVVWLFCTSLYAAPELPLKLEAVVGEMIDIEVKDVKTLIVLDITDGSRGDREVPVGLKVRKVNESLLIVNTRRPGVYLFICIDSTGKESRCRVTFIADIPPVPPDALTADLRGLYKLEDFKYVQTLSLIYAEAAKYATNTDITTTDQLLKAIKVTADGMIPSETINPLIRQRLGVEITTVLGSSSLDMTNEVRTKASKLFTRISTSLGELK